jgi:hypothetical protein
MSIKLLIGTPPVVQRDFLAVDWSPSASTI